MMKNIHPAQPPNSPERELLNIYPKTYKFCSALMMVAVVIILIIRWPSLVENNFPLGKILDLVVLFIGALWLSTMRVILTTHRIAQRIPFLKYQIERQYIEDIKIVPDVKSQQRMKYPLLLKPLFKKTPQHDDEHWREHGCLWFKHQQQHLNLWSIRMVILPLHIFSTEQRHELISAIQRHWGFDATQVVHTVVQPIQTKYASEDIGNRTPALIIFSILLVISAMFAPVFLFKAQHFAVESYLWAIPLIIAMTLLAYPFIRAENKKYPLIGTICSGIFLGAALYFVSLQLNRWYSESHHSTLNSTLTLESIENNVQVWRLPPDLAENMDIDKIYVSDRISGFNNKLQPQKNYHVEIKQGFFQDYFVDSASLKNIQAIAK